MRELKPYWAWPLLNRSLLAKEALVKDLRQEFPSLNRNEIGIMANRMVHEKHAYGYVILSKFNFGTRKLDSVYRIKMILEKEFHPSTKKGMALIKSYCYEMSDYADLILDSLSAADAIADFDEWLGDSALI